MLEYGFTAVAHFTPVCHPVTTAAIILSFTLPNPEPDLLKTSTVPFVWPGFHNDTHRLGGESPESRHH